MNGDAVRDSWLLIRAGSGSTGIRLRGLQRGRGRRGRAFFPGGRLGAHVVFVGDAGDGFVPAHGVTEAGVGADGFDISGGGELDFFAALGEIGF